MRVIIAEDHPLFVEGLTTWLGELGIEVVGSVATATDLVERVLADPPDVAIVDVSMPPAFDDEGLQAAETLAVRAPQVGVLVISAHREAGWAARLLRRRPVGVGYLLKHNITDAERLQDALERVRTGGVAIDPEVVADLMAERSSAPALASLTPREHEVLTQVAQGHSNRGIARRLGIEERTVENHVTNLFHKLRLPEGNQRVLAVLELQRAHRRRHT